MDPRSEGQQARFQPQVAPDPTPASTPPLTLVEVLQGTLQRAWDEWTASFAASITDECSRDPAQEPKLGRARVHQPSELWLNLDDCMADEEPGTSFAYGALMAVHSMAHELGVKLDFGFPEIREDDHGDVADQR